MNKKIFIPIILIIVIIAILVIVFIPKKENNVLHGFIKENNSEYEKLHDKNKTSKSPEAEKVAREAEDYIMKKQNRIFI